MGLPNIYLASCMMGAWPTVSSYAIGYFKKSLPPCLPSVSFSPLQLRGNTNVRRAANAPSLRSRQDSDVRTGGGANGIEFPPTYLRAQLSIMIVPIKPNKQEGPLRRCFRFQSSSHVLTRRGSSAGLQPDTRGEPSCFNVTCGELIMSTSCLQPRLHVSSFKPTN